MHLDPWNRTAKIETKWFYINFYIDLIVIQLTDVDVKNNNIIN
jgi:hypothetical protein